MWRFYVVFNRRRWALYIPGAAVVINACEYNVLNGRNAFNLTAYYISAMLVCGRSTSCHLSQSRLLRKDFVANNTGYFYSLGVAYVHHQHASQRRHLVENHASILILDTREANSTN